jgi:hypothetical protein
MLLYSLNFFTQQIMKMTDSKFLQHYCWRLEALGYTGLLDWKWRHYCPLKHWEPLAYWHCGISQITRVFKWWRLFCNFLSDSCYFLSFRPKYSDNCLFVHHSIYSVRSRDQVYYLFKVADEIIVLFWAGNETLTGLELVVVSILLFIFTVNVIYLFPAFPKYFGHVY